MITPIQHAQQQKPQSARWCPCCGQITVVPKGQPSPWPKVTSDMIAAAPELIEALRRLLNAFTVDASISPSMPIRISIETNGVAIAEARAALLAATGKATL